MKNAVAQQPKLEAAIRRSRNARAGMQSRRRRSLGIAAALSGALAGAGIVSLDTLVGSDVIEAAVAKAEGLADLISRRSPGERRAVRLTKARHGASRARELGRAPQLAVGAPPFEVARILMAAPAEDSLDLEPPRVPTASLVAPQSLAALLAASPAVGAAASPSGGTGVAGRGNAESFPNQPREPVPSAVPEPASWVLMLLGFALTGWRARRTGTALQKPA